MRGANVDNTGFSVRSFMFSGEVIAIGEKRITLVLPYCQYGPGYYYLDTSTP